MYGEYGQREHELRFTNEPHPRETQVVDKGLWSTTLQKWIRFKVSTAALREMERKGGLDEYILFTDEKDLGGPNSVGVLFKRGLQEALLKQSSTTTEEKQRHALLE